MKSEPKAFASLSSGLLARKGSARPAMRPQGFGQAGASLDDLGWNDMGFEAPKPAAAPFHEEGHDSVAPLPSRTPLAGLTPVQSPVHSQQAEIVNRLVPDSSDEGDEDFDPTAEPYVPELEAEQAGEMAPAFAPLAADEAPAAVERSMVAPAKAVRRAAKPRSAPGSKAKAAFTLRLDPARHLKLRLACAVSGRSAQQIVTDALDGLLAQMPELDVMAAKANRKG